MRKKTLLTAIVCIALFTQGLAADEPFKWKIALVKHNQGMQGVPLDKNGSANMNTGDIISIQVNSEKDCYVYIVLENANGRIMPLPTLQVKAGSRREEITKGTLNPPSGQGNSQQEKFHVVTSLREITDLQEAIDQFNREGTEINARFLRNLLKDLSDDDNDFGQPLPAMGGIRGNIQETEFSGDTVYVRTITINY